MPVQLLDTITLLGLRTKKLQRFIPVFKDRFFPMMQTFDTEQVAFDEIETDVTLAPLVSPVVNGKVIEQKGQVMKSLTPAYVKPKHRVDPTQTMKRMAGEALGGELSPAERRNLIRTLLVNQQEDMITHREELMCVHAIVYGKLLLEGEEYQTQLIDYERRPENTVILAGAEKWDVKPAEYDPTPDFEAWAGRSLDIAQDVYMHRSIWNLFRKFNVVRELLKKDSGSKSKGELGPRTADIFQWKMTFGDFEIYVYDGKYKDSDGTRKTFFPEGGILFAPSTATAGGVMAYGAIQDLKANESGVVAAARWPKNIETEEPSAEYIVTHSAPLPVTDDPDRYVYVNVLAIAPPY
ncbi:major capsid protein [Vibrio cholerae]|nr:major capsid protein [Vibrio cholerae]